MGDRCYMNVTCRREHVARFEELGFTAQNDEGGLAEMVDEEANYGHSGDMPTDVPYTGYHTAGGDYGSMDFACDGNTFTEWETGQSGGYVFSPDTEGEHEGEISLGELEQFKEFLRVRRAAHAAIPYP